MRASRIICLCAQRLELEGLQDEEGVVSAKKVWGGLVYNALREVVKLEKPWGGMEGRSAKREG